MRISLSCLLLALALAGCDRPKPEDDKPAAPVPAAPAAVVPSAAPAEQPGELALGDLTGIWRVTGVVPDQASSYVTDDPRIVGSLIDVLPDQIRWSYKASADFASDDVCLGPVAGLIDDNASANKARQLIAPALVKLRAHVSGLSQPHQWLCGDGGTWGNDTEFQRLAEGKVAMRWTGNMTLILNRVRQVASNPPPLPPSGAYEDH